MTDKVWTAAELEQMTPERRREIFEAGIVWDLDEVPPEFLARIRARTQAHIDGAEAATD